MSELARQYDAVNLVADPLHGYIKITKRVHGGSVAAEQDLLDHPWLQRLRRIHQLQSAWWVFPGGEHSRFQHALGAMHLSGEWARRLYPNLSALTDDVQSLACVEETLRVAGLLHDIGHGPFGHFFDQNYLDRFGIDHEVIGRALIGGELASTVAARGASPSGPLAAGERIDPRWIADLIAEPDLPGVAAPAWVKALKPVLNGMYTADNLDYVPRKGRAGRHRAPAALLVPRPGGDAAPPTGGAGAAPLLERPPLPVQQHLLPPDGAPDRPPHARDLPGDDRPDPPRQSARPPRSLPGADRLVADRYRGPLAP